MHKPYISYAGKEGKFKIWIVDGEWIRNNLFLDFTEGGNSERYDFIPKNEIWIDNANKKEKQPIKGHEIYEDKRMSKGISYAKAHDEANVVETKIRGSQRIDLRQFRKGMTKETKLHGKEVTQHEIMQKVIDNLIKNPKYYSSKND